MKTLNSESNPIYINQVVPSGQGSRGWVALSMAPGRKGQGRSASWDRDLDTDLDRLRGLGVGTLVCLLGDKELSRLGIPGLAASAPRKGLSLRRFAMPAGQVPSDMDRFLGFVHELAGRWKAGERLLIHDKGGGSRAALVAACLRLVLKLDADTKSAINSVRRIRSGGVLRRREHERFVERFRKAWLAFIGAGKYVRDVFHGLWYPRKPGPGVEEGEKAFVEHGLMHDVDYDEERDLYTCTPWYPPGGHVQTCDFTNDLSGEGWVEPVTVIVKGKVFQTEIIRTDMGALWIADCQLDCRRIIMEVVKA